MLTKRSYQRHLPAGIRALLAILILTQTGQVQAADPQAIEYHNGELTIALSAEVARAVDNGVPLTFISEYAVVTQILFFKIPRHIQSHQFVVTHHALSNRYLVSDGSDLAPNIFSSLTSTMDYVASSAMGLFNHYHSPETPYRMRLRLSKVDLPGPMRLSAFITEDWDINSGWKKWQSVP
ncbi:DUF4390 domain-containing protein [Arenicella xantha]|uniref:Uncharacterized protein DUF4390 n=1 Tax=Arenicella xantha TaxID=644221 RepID=A0A395JM21_9GAMM|nr:DUF4390 domain-containing protein [Arenicella xantha]RBP48830.1 uncharacterized protein DUF4390 [Arenicella xantha]